MKNTKAGLPVNPTGTGAPDRGTGELPGWITSPVDPHWSGPARFTHRREENDAAYRRIVEQGGIEFRGYRFWPPFFCFTCGRGISANQWLFSRICGSCDSELGLIRSRSTDGRIFAGRVEIEEATRKGPSSIVERTEEAGGFLDPRVEPGKSLSAHAASLRIVSVQSPAKPSGTPRKRTGRPA